MNCALPLLLNHCWVLFNSFTLIRNVSKWESTALHSAGRLGTRKRKVKVKRMEWWSECTVESTDRILSLSIPFSPLPYSNLPLSSGVLGAPKRRDAPYRAPVLPMLVTIDIASAYWLGRRRFPRLADHFKAYLPESELTANASAHSAQRGITRRGYEWKGW